jgi:hypothetical protein
MERFEKTTTVRRPRVALMLTVMGALVALMILQQALARLYHVGWAFIQPWWLIGPIIAAIQRRPKVEQAKVEAFPDGIRVAGQLVPRAKLKSALLRREAERTFVLLRGGASIDVEVSDDEEADRLCSALALDAKSTTAEFTLFRAASSRRMLLFVVLGMVAMGGAAGALVFAHVLLPLFLMILMFGLVVVGLPLYLLMRRTKLLVGADGIVVREGFGRRRFYSHDEITKVTVTANTVLITRKHGDPVQCTVGSGGERNKKQLAELERQAQSIAWRIEKARDAYRALAGDAPQGALVLERGTSARRRNGSMSSVAWVKAPPRPSGAFSSRASSCSESWRARRPRPRSASPRRSHFAAASPKRRNHAFASPPSGARLPRSKSAWCGWSTRPRTTSSLLRSKRRMRRTLPCAKLPPPCAVASLLCSPSRARARVQTRRPKRRIPDRKTPRRLTPLRRMPLKMPPSRMRRRTPIPTRASSATSACSVTA